LPNGYFNIQEKSRHITPLEVKIRELLDFLSPKEACILSYFRNRMSTTDIQSPDDAIIN